jgi:DNA-binding NtrC family response regulator
MKSYRILHLDDSDSDGDLVKQQLTKAQLNFEYLLVKNRESFIQSLEHFKPEVILCDHSLPQFNSMQAHEIYLEKKIGVPFILVAGSVSEDYAVAMIKRGIDDYLLKGNLQRLAQAIEGALNKKKNELKIKEDEKKLKEQNIALKEIAFMLSHQARAPIASVLGLISLLNTENLNDPTNIEVLENIKKTSKLFDNALHEIVKSTTEINRME